MSVDWTLTWTTVYALATVAMVFTLAIGSWVGLKQYTRGRLEYKYLILRDLSYSWESEQLVEARWKINSLGDRLSDELIRAEETNHRDYYILIRVGTFLEDAASLGIAGVISPEDVRGLFGTALIQHYFNLYEPYIRHEENRQPRLFTNFRRLAREETNR